MDGPDWKEKMSSVHGPLVGWIFRGMGDQGTKILDLAVSMAQRVIHYAQACAVFY